MALPSEDKSPAPDLPKPLVACAALVESLYAQSGASRWGLSLGQFASGLERSVRKRFAADAAARERLEDYLLSLHVEDLALATACLEGSEAAWDDFVREYRGYLRAAAGAVTKASRFGANARELADSLFSDLFGLMDGKRGERSLLRYFHGRSTLKTWLRAVLAQRHVDQIRRQRRWESLDADDGEKPELPPERLEMPVLDPDRAQYLSSFSAALQHAVNALSPVDLERVELYYARQMKLAEIGRHLGEHESSVSRNLERIRGELRAATEQRLREAFSLSEAEIERCFAYASEDVPIDFRRMFPDARPGGSQGKQKDRL